MVTVPLWGNARRQSAVAAGLHSQSHVPFCRIFDENGGQLQDNGNVSEQRLGLRIAGLIFLLIALIHVFRVAAHIEVQIAGRDIPMWASPLAAIIFGGLGIWFWILAKRGPQV